MSRHRAVKDMLRSEGGLDDGYDSDDDGIERRYDTDGCAYTYDEFLEEYGREDEWYWAKPVKQHRAPQRASKKAAAAVAKPSAPKAKPSAADATKPTTGGAKVPSVSTATNTSSSASASTTWRSAIALSDIDAHIDYLLSQCSEHRADFTALDYYPFSSSNPAPALPPIPTSSAAAVSPSLLVTTEVDTFEAGQLLVGAGMRPAVLNMANAYNCGGAWCEKVGSQEEDLFRRSSLPLSLWPRRRADDHRLAPCEGKIPRSAEPPIYPWTDAAVAYSPNVLVCRSASMGPPLPAAQQSVLAVVSCAAQDLRPERAEHSGPFSEALTREKCRSLLWAATMHGADCLVLGALGCGAFRNDPTLIADTFASLLEPASAEFYGRFKVVVFGIIKSKESLRIFGQRFPLVPLQELALNLGLAGWPPAGCAATPALLSASPSDVAQHGGARATAPLPALLPPPPSKQLNMVVIGHVDAGKSTLMGRLLLHAGKVDARTMHKYTNESQLQGKGSFRFAWVMDQSEEERARGVTVEVGTAFFSSGTREVNVLDAPGHRDFVPSMIGGASQADVALLVVNASKGEFESGLNGQTKEHIILARSLGVQRVLVAVNQMDSTGWSEERFEFIRSTLTPVLQQSGYRSPSPLFIPLSALAGENIALDTRPASGLEWYAGRSLLEEIDRVEPLHRASTVGTRLAVSDAFRQSVASMGTLALSGTLQAGTLSLGQRLLLLPSQEIVTVKSLHSRGLGVGEATAGDHVEVGLTATSSSFDPNVVGTGSVLCDPLRPVALATRIEVQLRVLASHLTKGQPFELHSNGGGEVACTLRKLIAAADHKTGERIPDSKPPRSLGPGTVAFVQLRLERPLPIEVHSDCRQLGRVVLRDAGETVAAGLVMAIERTATSGSSSSSKRTGRGKS